MNTKERILQKLHEKLEGIQAQINKINEMGECFEKLELEAYFQYQNQIDLDHLSHDKIIEVIKAVGGKWKKELSSSGSTRIDYSTEIKGVTIRCYAGEPPPNCKIVEEIETIPAQPERTVTIRKLVCI